jgi:hypothetical protein
MELTPENVTKVLAAIGIEDKVEDVEVDSVVTRATELAARPEKAEADERTLEERAREDGKVVLDSVTVADLKTKADKGEQALNELHQDKFDRAYSDAVEEGRVKASDETKARLQKLYNADSEACLEDLASREKIVNTSARGSGESKDKTEAPEGVDPESHELNELTRAYMEEHDESDYEKAYDKVVAARRKAATS